jgi:hypothetical protein
MLAALPTNGETSQGSISCLNKVDFIQEQRWLYKLSEQGSFMRTTLRLWIAVDYLIALSYLNSSTSWIIALKDGHLFVLLL